MWIKICAEEELLLVKILFEEVSLKARFEGRDKRAVRESERKRIPVLDRSAIPFHVIAA